MDMFFEYQCTYKRTLRGVRGDDALIYVRRPTYEIAYLLISRFLPQFLFLNESIFMNKAISLYKKQETQKQHIC